MSAIRPKLVLLAAAAALVAGLVLVAAGAWAASRAALESDLAGAREEAGGIAASLQASRARLATAESEAGRAERHESALSALLAEGEEHERELAARSRETRRQLRIERGRLRRARVALAARLVAIYENGTPDTASLIFGAGDYGELATQSDYLRLISESDTALADRVETVRDTVHRTALRVAALQRRAAAYDRRLAAARAQIDAVRAQAAESAARLATIAGEREVALGELRVDIDRWVGEVQRIRRAEAKAASEAEAEEEVGRWLGGPYTIPTYIVMCESGGDYGAVNPSSGAGGAYQILPSTWELYGGQGAPQDAPKAEQDRIAAEIYADSGSSAWVCG